MDYEAAAHDRYETDSFCVADDESLGEHASEEGDSLEHFEETEDTVRIDAERMTRLKKATKRSRQGYVRVTWFLSRVRNWVVRVREILLISFFRSAWTGEGERKNNSKFTDPNYPISDSAYT